MAASNDFTQEESTASISVITATYNASKHLPTLIESLRSQIDKNFEWIVADGASTDGTIELLKDVKDLNIEITSQPDYGIYDALNRGIRIASCNYYIVVGADDILFPDAIRSFRKYASKYNTDIITAKVKVGDKVVARRTVPQSIGGAFSVVSSHSVGCLFKRDLHDRYGYYSNKYPIAADKLFISNIYKGQGTIKAVDFVAGVYGTDGKSSKDVLGSLTESFRIKLQVENNKFLQCVLFILRIIKNYRRL